MTKNAYEILGLSSDCLDEELQQRYQELKEKYNEERFCEGEKGNDAARMLTEIDVAYSDIMRERQANESRKSYGNIYGEIEELIRNNDINGAQEKLDSFNERNSEWHYLQSVIFFRKKWNLESKKQLEIAMNLEPNNAKYKNAYDKLIQVIEAEKSHPEQEHKQSSYTGNEYQEQMMGGGFCNNTMNCCSSLCCADMCCECFGGDICPCC